MHLIDGTEVASDANSVWRYRVVAVRAGRADTLPDLFADGHARLVGDSAVYGIALDSAGESRGAFRYTVRAGLELEPLPADAVYGLTVLDVAPDGAHLAYVAFDGQGRARGVVRRWPAGPVVATTPAVPVASGDAFTGSAEWASAREFVVYIDQSGRGDPWTRLRGALDRSEVVIDTVPAAELPADRRAG